METNNATPPESNSANKAQESNLFLKYLPEIISAVTSMGGSYMLWVKPLQDRMEMMSRQIMELQDELREVLRQNKHLQRELEAQSGQNKLSGTEDFLPTRGKSPFPAMRRI